MTGILFLGSGHFALPALETLTRTRRPRLAIATVPAARRGRGHRVEPTPVAQRARELGVPCRVVATLAGGEGARLLAETGAELAICADFRLFLPSRFLRSVRLHCYNLHPSLLPRYRGAAPVVRAVLAGERVFGVTLARMVREMDAGPIVAQERVQPHEKLDALVLQARLAEVAARMLEGWIERLERGEVSLREQDEELATTAPRISKEEGWIDWCREAEEIENRVLAFRGWPRTSCAWQRSGAAPVRLFIDEVAPLAERAPALAPGTVRAASGGRLVVACGAEGCGSLRIVRLQRPGRRCLEAAEFLRGFPIEVGDTLAASPPAARG